MLKKYWKFALILYLCAIAPKTIGAIDTSMYINNNENFLTTIDDSLFFDSIPQNHQPIDSNINIADTTNFRDSTKSKSLLDSPIEYNAEDSIMFSLDNKKVFLYGNAIIKYQDMELTSAFIELDLDKNEIFATGMPDSAGVITGNPVFKEGSEEYKAKNMQYNFKTRKGIIKEVKTEESEGFLHASRTKRHSNGEIHMKRGKYTTCDHDHPHFYLALTRAKVIPNDKIVSGPAYMVVEDVPLYFPILPFGFFPNTREHSSGIILPEYGEEDNRGFYLRGGGYYFAINDYFDFTITGDFFTEGTWGASSIMTYKKRYRFNGRTEMRYYTNASGDRDIPGDFIRSRDFSLRWSHSQDAKANPYNRLSASVNFSTKSFDENYSRQASNYLNNTKQSNISFSKTWPNKPFDLSLNLRHSQNSLSEVDQLKLLMPSLTFNVKPQYPFKRKNRSGPLKWYEKISIDYKSQLQNNLETTDSMFFNHFEFQEKDFGFKHGIPLSTNIKFLKIFTFSPGVNYNGMIYTKKIEKREWIWTDEDQENGKFVDSISHGFNYIHGYSPRASISANPTLYGMYMFKKGSKVEAIRHVFDPNVSFSFVPDMKELVPNYYDEAYNEKTQRTVSYSKYEGSSYGTPTLPGRSGRVSFSLRNNVEMKVKTSTDTTQDVKKIKIIDNLSMSTSYNVYSREGQRAWSNVNMSTSNRFFNDKLNLRLTATGSLYAIDSVNQREHWDKFIWQSTSQPLRFTNAKVSFGSSFKSKQGSKNESDANTDNPELESPEDEIYNEYVNFDIPWDFRFDYSFVYSKPLLTQKITQTFSFSGNFSLTPKWKIGFRSGWDFDRKELTYTTVNIYRDLHCWEARFNWVPFGRRKSYGFTITAKSSILRDLKWDKPKESWWDNK